MTIDVLHSWAARALHVSRTWTRADTTQTMKYYKYTTQFERFNHLHKIVVARVDKRKFLLERAKNKEGREKNLLQKKEKSLGRRKMASHDQRYRAGETMGQTEVTITQILQLIITIIIIIIFMQPQLMLLYGLFLLY